MASATLSSAKKLLSKELIRLFVFFFRRFRLTSSRQSWEIATSAVHFITSQWQAQFYPAEYGSIFEIQGFPRFLLLFFFLSPCSIANTRIQTSPDARFDDRCEKSKKQNEQKGQRVNWWKTLWSENDYANDVGDESNLDVQFLCFPRASPIVVASFYSVLFFSWVILA